jgi:glycosyltransferase involved in cell wall biosynthesis
MSQSNIKLSIIICCYNSLKYIEETLNSCLNQSIVEKEIILVDDGSTDGTKEFLKNAKSISPLIKVIFNEENLGLPRSVNKGVEIAEGEFVSLVGHDDFFDVDHFEKMINFFDRDSVLVYCNSYLVDEKSERKTDLITSNYEYVLNSEIQEENLRKVNLRLGQFNFISSCGMVMRKNAFNSVKGWSPIYKVYGEWLLYTKLIQNGSFKFCDSTIGNYRIHQTNISKTLTDVHKLREVNNYYQNCRFSALKNSKLSMLDTIRIWYRIVRSEFVFIIKYIIRKI